MEDFLSEILSALLEFLINNNKVPKAVRYGIIILTVGLIVFVGVSIGLQSEYLIGKIAGFLVSALIFTAGMFLMLRIHKS